MSVARLSGRLAGVPRASVPFVSCGWCSCCSGAWGRAVTRVQAGRGCWSGQTPVQPVRVKSAVQLVSQVWPPSSENACSHLAVVAVMSDHL
jgi:hypothetical protein